MEGIFEKSVRFTGLVPRKHPHLVGSVMPWISYGPRVRTGLCGRSHDLLCCVSFGYSLLYRLATAGPVVSSQRNSPGRLGVRLSSMR